MTVVAVLASISDCRVREVSALFGVGSPAAGGMTSLEIVNGMGGANAFLALGSSNKSVPFGGPNCSIQIMPLTGIFFPFRLSGTAAGKGRASFNFSVPPNLKADGYWQIAIADINGAVVSNPIHMHIE